MTKNEKKNKKTITIIGYIFTVLLMISIGFSTSLVIYLNVLPLKYLVPLIIIVLLIVLGISLVLIKKKFKNWFKIIMMVISAIIIIICSFISYYMIITFKFMDKINVDNKTYESYYVLVKKDSPYNDIKDIKDLDMGVFNEDNDTYNEAITKLNEVISVKLSEQDSVNDLSDKLLNDKLSVILMSNIEKETIEADDNTFDSKVKSIYTIEVEQKEAVEEATTAVDDISKDTFTVYVSGIDSYGSISTRSRSDVNMLATINPTTHEILLTSIPRDYYVQLHGTKGYKDKLTHAGIYGVNMSVQTIEDFMNIDINYYLRVNFSTLIKVVDLIGGIDVYSDKSFTPWTNQSITINKGNVHMNGATALAFARERHAYEEGDRHRVQNQQDVITAIIKKLTSSTTLLTKYSSLLNSVSGSFQTDVNMDDVTELIKLQIDKMPSWTIKRYSLNGTDSHGYTYSMGKQSLYVMEPDQGTITNGHNYITGMEKGKTLKELGL